MAERVGINLPRVNQVECVKFFDLGLKFSKSHSLFLINIMG